MWQPVVSDIVGADSKENMPPGQSPGKDYEDLKRFRTEEIETTLKENAQRYLTRSPNSCEESPLSTRDKENETHTAAPPPAVPPLLLSPMCTRKTRRSSEGTNQSPNDSRRQSEGGNGDAPNEFMQKLARRRYRCDEAGEEFVRERNMKEGPDCSFYEHHESQFTPREAKETKGWAAEMEEREKQISEREQDMSVREEQMCKASEELSTLAQSVAEREAAIEQCVQELEQEKTQHQAQASAASQTVERQTRSLREQEEAVQAESESLRLLGAELRAKEQRLSEQTKCCSTRRFMRGLSSAANFFLRWAVRVAVIGALLFAARPEIESWALEGADVTRPSESSEPVPVTCPPAPAPVPCVAPPLRFQAPWNGTSVALALRDAPTDGTENSLGCLPAEAAHTRKVLEWSLAEVGRLKEHNAVLLDKAEGYHDLLAKVVAQQEAHQEAQQEVKVEPSTPSPIVEQVDSDTRAPEAPMMDAEVIVEANVELSVSEDQFVVGHALEDEVSPSDAGEEMDTKAIDGDGDPAEGSSRMRWAAVFVAAAAGVKELIFAAGSMM